jgi:protein-tyrosine-phosphatase
LTYSTTSAPPILGLLFHDVRWQLIQALSHSDQRVHELVAIVGKPMNLVSYHLKKLRDGHFVHERRSSADARDVYYSLDLEQLRIAFLQAGKELHPAFAQETALYTSSAMDESRDPVRVLFLCTHNSARSQMAEALLRELGSTRVEVRSAGTEPATVHELAIQVLGEMGIDMADQRSKHVNEFLGETFDYIITVCDRAREECPVFPGDPEQIHWSFADPAEVTGSEETRLTAFRETGLQLNTRLRYFWLAVNRV